MKGSGIEWKHSILAMVVWVERWEWRWQLLELSELEIGSPNDD